MKPEACVNPKGFLTLTYRFENLQICNSDYVSN